MSQVQKAIIIENKGFESYIKTDPSALNYYVEATKDTIWFNHDSNVARCNYMISILKSHNHCSFNTFGKSMNGYFTIYTVHDQMINEYKGTLKNGLYDKGTITRYFNNGSIQLTGQYINNWKYGYWASYDSTGTLLYLNKFIEGADIAVVEFILGENGEIIEKTDEEDVINELIKNAPR